MANTNIETQKLELIQWLAAIENSSLLDRISAIKEQSITDWWNEISESEKASIATGIEQADRGQLRPHSEARAIYDEWL